MQDHEFDVTVTVRKRVHVAGPETREAARTVLQTCLANGMKCEHFARFDADGRPNETVLSEVVIEDPASDERGPDIAEIRRRLKLPDPSTEHTVVPLARHSEGAAS